MLEACFQHRCAQAKENTGRKPQTSESRLCPAGISAMSSCVLRKNTKIGFARAEAARQKEKARLEMPGFRGFSAAIEERN
jgi:hypothetical protein